MALITLQEGTVGSTFTSNSTITQVDSKSIDVLSCDVLPTLTAEINDEVKYYDESNTFIFGGFIKTIKNETMKRFEVHDYGTELVDKLLNEVYRNMSPEAILQDIITNHTNLIWNSSVVTNTIITKIVFKDQRIIDVINELIALFAGNWRTDKDKNFYLETVSENVSGATLTEGVELNLTGWNLNTDKQATKVIVKGANYRANTTETITGTNTVFTLAREPADLKVTVAGVEKIQTVDGQIAGDYTVDVQAKTVTFTAGSETDPTFNYTYESQIKVTAGSGTIEKEIVKPYIENMQEARALARNYLSTYQDGILNATFKTNTLDLTQYKPNYKIYTVDNVRTPNIAEYFMISKVVRKYPGTIEVTVGEQEVNLFDWQKETQERVKQLEKKDDNTDFIQLYEFIGDGLSVKFTLSIPRAQYRSASTNNFTLNDPVKGHLNNTTYLVSTSSGAGVWTDF